MGWIALIEGLRTMLVLHKWKDRITAARIVLEATLAIEGTEITSNKDAKG